MEIRTVNYQYLQSNHTARRNSEIELMHLAFADSGFFTLIDHGLEEDVEKLFEFCSSFFDRAQSEKESVPRSDRYGYVPITNRAIDRERKSGNAEFLDIGLSDEVKSAVIDEYLNEIRSFQSKGVAVALALLRQLTHKIGVAENFFDQKMNDPQCRMRFLHYPRSSGSSDYPLKPHTDYGLITLLATDGTPGLEIRQKDVGWVAIDPPEQSLVVNLGDMLARWTNDRYNSTPHRVRAPKEVSRYSIPFFINPNPDTVIETIQTCVTERRPNMYDPVTAGNYLAARIDGDAEPYIRTEVPD